MRVDALLPVIEKRLARVRRDASVDELLQLLGGRGCDLVVVCDGAGFALGVVTRTDGIRHVNAGGRAQLASQVMSRPIIACSCQDDVAEVWHMMHARQLSNLPVLNQRGLPIGVLAARDAITALLAEEREEEAALIRYIAGFGYR